MRTFRLFKSSLGITIFLFSLYNIIGLLVIQKNFDVSNYLGKVVNSIGDGLFQSKSFYYIFVFVFILMIMKTVKERFNKIKNEQK